MTEKKKIKITTKSLTKTNILLAFLILGSILGIFAIAITLNKEIGIEQKNIVKINENLISKNTTIELENKDVIKMNNKIIAKIDENGILRLENSKNYKISKLQENGFVSLSDINGGNYLEFKCVCKSGSGSCNTIPNSVAIACSSSGCGSCKLHILQP